MAGFPLVPVNIAVAVKSLHQFRSAHYLILLQSARV
jgi:hypothetical protein